MYTHIENTVHFSWGGAGQEKWMARASPASCLYGQKQNKKTTTHTLTHTHSRTRTHAHAYTHTHRSCLTQASLALGLAIVHFQSPQTLFFKSFQDVWILFQQHRLQQPLRFKLPFPLCCCSLRSSTKEMESSAFLKGTLAVVFERVLVLNPRSSSHGLLCHTLAPSRWRTSFWPFVLWPKRGNHIKNNWVEEQHGTLGDFSV